MKVAFLSNFTIDLLAKQFRDTYGVEIFISGFDQFRFDISNRKSDYYAANPEFTVLFLDWESLLTDRTIDDLKADIINLFRINCNSINNYFIINTAFLIPTVNSIHAYNLEGNLKEIQSEINSFLAQLSYANSNFFVIDLLSELELYGAATLFDSASWIYARNRFSKFGLVVISRKLRNLINAISDVQQKCIVVDLDNTLWGGVLGEDGIFGIRLGNDGLGDVYKKVQKTIKDIHEKGVILCICSKNNYEDVVDIFTNNSEMCLSLDDFLIKKINWERKDINIKEISLELGIAEEYIVFLDDDPYERKLVKENTSVIVPDFPSSVDEITDFILKLDEEYFPKFNITEEDKTKTKMYRENFARQRISKSSTDFNEFLKSLDIKLEVKQARESDLPRLAQLTQKTNQFNLNCIRFTENELRTILESDTSSIFFGEVKDKFGDYGKVLLSIFECINNTAVLKTFLMSCRVIGRDLEGQFIREVASRLVNIDRITAGFIQLDKNQMVYQKLLEIGFDIEFVEGNRTHFLCNMSNLTKKNEK